MEDLRALGVPARLVEAAPGRPNVVAGADDPEVVLCTHIDVVDPPIPSSEDDTWIYGRGACDAKGCMVAQVAAWLALDPASRERVGLLFVAGEERDHVGAMAARSLPFQPASVILGEPCDLLVSRAQKGMLKLRVMATGVAAHSAYPDCGVSAIHRLLDALSRLRSAEMPRSQELGETTFHVGLVSGGVAPNVIAPEAEAVVMFRQVVPAAELLGFVEPVVAGEGVTTEVLGHSDPILFAVPPGVPLGVVPFNTDASHLLGWAGRVLLAGPGEMTTAHGPSERIRKSDLLAGAQQYVELVRHELLLRDA